MAPHGAKGQGRAARSAFEREVRHPVRAGDFVVVGGPYEYNQRVPLILLGGSVRPRTFDASASPADIAPTLAAIAGVSLTGVEGRVLREAPRPAANKSLRNRTR